MLVQKDGEGVSARLVQRKGELESLEVGGDAAVFFAEEHRLLGMMVLDGELDVGLDRVGEETRCEDVADRLRADSEGVERRGEHKREVSRQELSHLKKAEVGGPEPEQCRGWMKCWTHWLRQRGRRYFLGQSGPRFFLSIQQLSCSDIIILKCS